MLLLTLVVVGIQANVIYDLARAQTGSGTGSETEKQARWSRHASVDSQTIPLFRRFHIFPGRPTISQTNWVISTLKRPHLLPPLWKRSALFGGQCYQSQKHAKVPTRESTVFLWYLTPCKMFTNFVQSIPGCQKWKHLSTHGTRPSQERRILYQNKFPSSTEYYIQYQLDNPALGCNPFITLLTLSSRFRHRRWQMNEESSCNLSMNHEIDWPLGKPTSKKGCPKLQSKDLFKATIFSELATLWGSRQRQEVESSWKMSFIVHLAKF